MKSRLSYDLPKRIAAKAMQECDDELYSQHCKGIFDEGDPNHPKYNNGINYTTGKPAILFGYDVDEFMAKQHKQ